MVTEDQSEVIAFLSSRPAHGGAEVERVETHASVVFLCGRHAFKLKRAVRYDYLDFSTVERRRQMCEAELQLNRRTAPHIYEAVVPVTRDADGALALDGDGKPIEWLLAMRRFDQEALFDRLAAKGALALDLMAPLAAAIARLHAQAAPRPDHGGAAGMRWIVDGNAHGFAEEGADVLDRGRCQRLTDAARAMTAHHAPLLDARRDRGLVRQCHGDLHLRNLVLLDDKPTLFDGIEFNDALACIDVHYDLAFLLMDLWHRGLRQHANAVLNAYLFETDDVDGLALLPLFLSCRAAVRAKTSATATALDADPAHTASLIALSRRYLELAHHLLEPQGSVVVAIGGFSGSGKSTLARALAPLLGAAPGAVIVRSDEIRKRLHGAAPLDRLGDQAYTPEVSGRVYASMRERVAAVAACGHAAIADAVFDRETDRLAIEQHAARTGRPFVGLWLDAADAVLLDRTARRRGDVSDADPSVVRQQLAHDPGAITWHRLAAGGSPAGVLAEAIDLLQRVCRINGSGQLQQEPTQEGGT